MTRSEYANLFADELPSEGPIHVHAPKFTINDGEPPGEDEIVEALLRTLKNNRAAGALAGLTAEDLKSWHEDAREPEEEGEEPDDEATILWEKVLELVQLAFEEGVIPLAFSQGIFVLISVVLHCWKLFINLYHRLSIVVCRSESLLMMQFMDSVQEGVLALQYWKQSSWHSSR